MCIRDSLLGTDRDTDRGATDCPPPRPPVGLPGLGVGSCLVARRHRSPVRGARLPALPGRLVAR
eukprot:15092160-Alexandrium_andersonii.AAC.1